MKTNSPAAASVCKCGDSGTMCSFSWTKPGECDGNYGIGQQLNALQAVQVNLASSVGGPVTQRDGGISRGDAAAGSGDGQESGGGNSTHVPASAGDKAGASVLSVLVLLSFVAGAMWIVL